MAKPGFKNCYYDRTRRKILLKEQGSAEWVSYDYNPWCYISDPTGKSTLTDIHKNPVKKHPYRQERELDVLRSSPNCIIAESDLRPEVKFMHEKYDFVDLEVDIADWNICLFDIEVAGSSKYYDDQQIDIRNLEKNIFKKIDLYTFDTKFDKTAYEVFDIEQNRWVKFADSCFVTYEFPAPEKADWPINLITCYSTKYKTRYTFGLKPYTDGADTLDNTVYVACTSEIDLIHKWTKWFNSMDFDIISGWNSISYDIPYIINRCAKLRELSGRNIYWERALSPLNLDPIRHDITDRKLEGVDLGATFEIPGLYSIDFMELYKTFGKHDPLPTYSLNFVSNLVLGDQKLTYSGSINETYKTDWNNFVRYNIKDVILLEKLFYKLKLFELIIEYAFDCIVTLDKIYNKVPTTTGYILRFLHKTNRVLNDKKKNHTDWWTKEKCYIVKDKDGNPYYQNTEWEDDNEEFQKYLVMDAILGGAPESDYMSKIQALWKPKTIKGVPTTSKQRFDAAFAEFRKWPHPFPEFHVKAGYCYDYPGRHDDCMSFDITSSYPHHIMQFNISPEVKVIHPRKEDIESGKVILTDVNEVGFLRTDDAILPNVVKKVFDERKHYKNLMAKAEAEGNADLANLYDNRQGVKKIIINSMYGVSLAAGFHLYDPDCARVICRNARCTLRDWLTKYLNEYYVSKSVLKDMAKEYSKFSPRYNKPLVVRGRDVCAVHNDTDSVYFSINELKNWLISEGIKIETEDEYRDFYEKAERVFQRFFDRILQIRAQKTKTTNKIKFNRENIFKNMFCFARKLYIGNIIDSEGHKYPFSKPKHKIMGVGIKKSTMPNFCKEAAEKLAFEICAGAGKEYCDKEIMKVYEQYRHTDINEISAVIGITNYKKYIPHDIDYYLEHGLEIDKGENKAVIFGAKVALTYNYILAKKRLKLTPISNNTKMRYLYVQPNNEFKYREIGKSGVFPVRAVAYLESWPEEFDKMFTIDYEQMFRTSFCQLFETMYRINGWITPKQHLLLEENPMDEFLI